MKKFIIIFFLVSCSSYNSNKDELDQISTREFTQPLREFKGQLNFKDFSNKNELIKAINQTLIYFKKTMNKDIVVADRVIKKIKYVRALNRFKRLVKNDFNSKDFSEKVREIFTVYEVFGKDDWSEILLTGYYTPVISVSKIKDNKYSRPIYKTPSNMKLPFYTRAQIDGEGKLEKTDLVIAYADPIDVFFLQIQGSGIGEYRNGTKRYFHFDSHNGYDYYSIGKSLHHIIPKVEMSMQNIRDYLADLSSEERDKILFKNPRYIFFKERVQKPRTHINTLAISGRSIATDKDFYHKGLLGFLKLEDKKIKSRFVFDHDIGGGVKGPYRVDIYMGEGKKAQIAGKLREQGQLYYLLPKYKE